MIDDNIRGILRVGATIEAKHPDKNSYLEATISKIIDASQYTVIFDDGDITTLRRTSLCLKSGKHFAESESLDHLPLTNPEHFGNPVSLNARGNRRRRRRSAYSTATAFSNSTTQFSDNDDNDSIEGSTSVDDEDSSSIITHQSSSTTSNFKLNSNSNNTNNGKDNATSSNQDYGKVVCVEYGDKRSAKLKDLWFPGLVVSPNAQADNNKPFDPSQEHLVKSFSNGRFYQLKRKDVKEFTREIANQILNDNCSSTSLKSAIEKALTYLDKNELPSSWDYETLIGSNHSTSLNENENGGEDENESSDDLDSLLEEDEDLDDAKSVEEKDRFVAQLYKYMDERGTPINKTPTIWGDDLDLYNLYRLVIKMGGYNRVCNKNGGWKAIYNKLNLPNNEVATQANANQLRLAYKKYLLNFVDFFRKLGCTMVDTCMYSSRSVSRTARCARSWRTLSESSKPQQQDTLTSKEKTRRKKSTNESIVANDKKEEDDKKSTATTDKTAAAAATTTLKKTRKNGRKKFKVEGDDPNVNVNVNGNEPEEKYIPHDSDFESDNEYNYSTPTISKDVTVNVGDRIRVKYGKGKQLKVYEAKVMNLVYINTNESDLQKIKYFVHYTGWNTRYDEWIKRNRIVEVVCDNKSPKRRGGNKSKNKGVPLTEEQLNIAVKIEQPPVKVEVPATPPVVASSGKRGRPSGANFRNQDKSTTEATTSTTTAKLKNETASVNNKKLPASSPVKRSRQRSECVETDQDENDQTNDDLASNTNLKATDVHVKKEALQLLNYGNEEEMDAENEDSSSDTTKEHQPVTKRGYKKSKRSDSQRKEEKLDVDLEQNSEVTNEKIVEDDSVNRRRQRKKKNDKPAEQQQTATAAAAKEDNNTSKQEQPNTATTASAKKRKLQQPTVSSDEDDSSNSSTSNTAPSNLNKFSKRKRILNSKYRQDNAPTSKTESTLSSSTSLSTKEIELTRKRSKEESIPIKTEEFTDEPPTKSNKQASSDDQSDAKETETTIPATSSSNEINSTNNFLLCKEEIPVHSPSCDESNHNVQSKNSSSTPDTNHQLKESKSTTQNNTTVQIQTASTKLCSTATNLDSTTVTTKETQSTKSTTSPKQIASTSSSQTNNATSTINDLSKKEIEDSESVHQQFTPPTTPESLKSNSTSSSHNDKDSNDEKLINDKTEINLQLSTNQKIETHGLDMIAIASGVSKLVDIDKQNDKKENNQDMATSNNNFSPRKKRRRGRTSSHSESHSSSVANNLFSTSFTNNKDNSPLVKDSAHKAKGCKTRGSLGRKVKQNQTNLDCMSESTSHSDNFEQPNSPSILLSCISLEAYNPTSKYNFCTPLDENLEAERRIQILQERLQELRKTYLNIKSELTTIERRRKKLRKRKERGIPSPDSQTENMNKTNSPQSSTSSTTSTKDHQSNLQRSNSFTENSNLDDNRSTECNLNEQSQVNEVC